MCKAHLCIVHAAVNSSAQLKCCGSHIIMGVFITLLVALSLLFCAKAKDFWAHRGEQTKYVWNNILLSILPIPVQWAIHITAMAVQDCDFAIPKMEKWKNLMSKTWYMCNSLQMYQLRSWNAMIAVLTSRKHTSTCCYPNIFCFISQLHISVRFYPNIFSFISLTHFSLFYPNIFYFDLFYVFFANKC